MTVGIRLIPLKCIQCAAPLPAQVDQVAWRCPTCGAGQRLEDEKLLPLVIQFAAKQENASWQPYWAFDGAVITLRRQTQSGSSKGFDWSKIFRFWVPAYALDLKRAQEVAARLTRTQPTVTAVPVPVGVVIANCTLLPDDARRLAEFVVLSLEAAQPDWLRELDFKLELGTPTLWMLPA